MNNSLLQVLAICKSCAHGILAHEEPPKISRYKVPVQSTRLFCAHVFTLLHGYKTLTFGVKINQMALNP
jgi:hypothetical protein